MARTRARVRREESISESSAASASESEAATAAIPDAPSSTSTSIAEEPSASEDEDEAHRKLLLAYQTTTRPRRTKLTARKSASEGGYASQDYLPPPARHGERGTSVEGSNAKRPFRPARSARKTAQPASLSSSANKARPGPSSSLARSAAAARNAVGYTLGGATTSEGEVALNEETSDDEPQEGHSQYETAPASLKRRRSTLTASGSRKAVPPQPDSDDEDEADVTMWVPVETGSSPVNTKKARQVPQPEEEEEMDPLTIARKAREILEAAMKPSATPMTRQKKDTLSAFLRTMEEGKEGVDKDTEVERILVDAFDIKNIKNAGPDFSINELIDIVTYILLFSTPDKEGEDGLYAQYEALKEGLPLAMDNFAASLVPLGMRLNQSILQLQFALKLQLLIARAKVADDILPEENGDLYVVDESLAVRFVDSGQEALWEDHQRKSEQMLDTIIDGNADVDELIVQYPFQTFFTAFLKHIKRVFAYLRRSPDGSRNGSVIPSSPNRYYQHIAKKRVKLDEVRRNSAPPPIRGVSAQFESPYQNLRESLRNARKSSPIRRAPSLFNPRPFSAIGTSRVQGNHQYSIREDSDEEVENELITRSSAALDSEPEGDELDQTITQAIVEEEENVDITMEADVELENIETQIPQRNLLDRSALGAFLEETQTETQTQVEARDSVQRDFWGEELVDGIETQAVHEDYQMGSYADLDSYEPPQDEDNVEDSQASTLPPGRSDAPSPSLANPQSYDDAASDPFLDSQTMQDGRVLETEEEAEVEIDELRSDTPGANRMAAEARAVFGAALEDDEEEVAGGGSVTNEIQEAPDVAEDSREGSKGLEDSAPTLPETQPIPQAAPARTRGRKGNNWFARQDDAERITMSSPAASSSSGKRALGTRASRKSGGGKQLLSPEPEGTGAEQEADEHLPPSSRKAKPSRKGLEYVDIEAAEETGEQPSQEVASTRQSARGKAASAPAPPKRRPGRPRKNPVDPEQAAPRATLPTRKSNRRTATIQRAVSPTSSGNRSIYQESSDEEDDMDVLASPERHPASQQDQLLDEEVEEEEEAAPVASTSTAKTKATAKRQGGQTSAAKKASAQPAKKASAKSKGKGRATSSAPAEENQANHVVAPGDGPWDGENDVDLLKEKRELFAEAMKVWKEGLEQSDRFKEIKERYNEIGLFHRTPYVDKAETKKTTWSPMERKVFLVAMDLLRNPFASRRYKSILEDHGINGVITRGLKDRKSSQLKDKGENIRLLHVNAPASQPAFAFFQKQVVINGEVVVAPKRKKRGAKGKNTSDDDEPEEIEDADDFQDAHE